MERGIINSCSCEKVLVVAIVSYVCIIGSNVDSVGGNGNRSGEIHLLPAGCGLAGKGGGGQARAGCDQRLPTWVPVLALAL